MNCRNKSGQTLVEFAASALLTVALLLAVVEFGRMALVYTTINNAARIGVRFAMVHGSDNAASPAQVTAVVKDYLSAAAIDTTSAMVTVSYPGVGACTVGNNLPGCAVEVVVSYPYQTMLTYFPISVTLGSQSEGVITF
jgi:Flp pilus assembly protein TadG